MNSELMELFGQLLANAAVDDDDDGLAINSAHGPTSEMMWGIPIDEFDLSLLLAGFADDVQRVLADRVIRRLTRAQSREMLTAAQLACENRIGVSGEFSLREECSFRVIEGLRAWDLVTGRNILTPFGRGVALDLRAAARAAAEVQS